MLSVAGAELVEAAALPIITSITMRISRYSAAAAAQHAVLVTTEKDKARLGTAAAGVIAVRLVTRLPISLLDRISPAVERGMIRPLAKLLRQMIGWPLEAAILYPLVGLLRLLPVQTASFLGCDLWSVGANLTFAQARYFQYRLCHAETTPAERRRIGRQAWCNMGRVFAEFFQIDQLINKGFVELQGGHHLSPKKAALSSAHISVAGS